MARLSPPRPAAARDRADANRVMFDRIAPRYDRLNRVLTLGLDARWRRRTVAALGLPAGSLVIDLACGTGDLCRETQRAGLRCVGVDVAARMLAHSHTSAPLVRADILTLPLAPGTADGAVCGFALRNVVDIPACLRETARVLRPGGRIGFLEVAEPANPLLRRGHALYFRRVVPFVGGLLSDREAYRYLPASTAWLPSPAELLAMVRDAGFTAVARRSLGGGAAQLLTGTRAG
ncbi:MAG: demethylmenaquinone methyltransferase / 2-methoxy-6-polyprenyl,4-benzoquinol methylase [Chloroflexota bacterium]|nr:demethylmenaquinone methyltransferase / 2-methoxy-6-polyprenyl,4-benzoquinol methylase [Chloroflexota bacterium]